MSQFIYQESRFLLISVCMGAVIAFVYDCLRILRRVFRHGKLWLSFEDLFYWIAVSLGIFCMLYYENNGVFRWFAVMGAAIGMAGYKILLGRFLVEFISRVLIGVKKLLGRIVAGLLAPFKRVKRFCGKKTRAGMHRIKYTARILKKRLTVQARLIRIELRTRYQKVDCEQENGQKKNRYQKEKTE